LANKIKEDETGGVSKRNKRNAYRMLVGKTKGKRPPVDLGVDEKIIFKQISQK
jgi:hypothetical protein